MNLELARPTPPRILSYFLPLLSQQTSHPPSRCILFCPDSLFLWALQCSRSPIQIPCLRTRCSISRYLGFLTRVSLVLATSSFCFACRPCATMFLIRLVFYSPFYDPSTRSFCSRMTLTHHLGCSPDRFYGINK